ncbi:hypothetical protein F7725_019884 [Dissostichus mawsoni]|uniref:SAM domain-containing protein n=1 Tax=Dissostichus mawsoni TaxID=36200 RepID=A0A7J5YL30_DISMA|nr:hypothetical protein F7725_019884 [Dissostichus mawsoni]
MLCCRVMGLSKRVSSWSVEEVLEWMQGRVLLRLKDHHLELLGVEAEEQQQEILQDVLLLKVQEEVNELNDICSVG